MPRRRRSVSRKIVVLLAVVLAAAAFLFYRMLFYQARIPAVGVDDASRQLDRVIATWAADEGFQPVPDGTRQETRRHERRKWLHIERAYRLPRGRSPAGYRNGLAGIAAARGLKLRAERASDGRLAGAFMDAEGRELVRVVLWGRAVVAIVIDDMGYSLDAARRVMRLPCALTVSVLPFTPRAVVVAGMARASGKEVFVHMPMQPAYELPDVPEYSVVLRPAMSLAEVRARVEKACAAVPHAVGLNNHEGSEATRDRLVMAHLMRVLKERGLIFIDSATSADTVGWKVAMESGVRWGRRRVFLDSERNVAFVEEAFTRMLRKARVEGEVIAIGHPAPATLEVLERRIPRARQQGVEFVRASVLARLY